MNSPRPSATSPGNTHPGEKVVASYQQDSLRLLLIATRLYAELSGRGGTCSEVVNFLRGAQAPPQRSVAQPEQLPHCFGILAAVQSRWVAEAFERLVENGYVEPSPQSPTRWVLSRAGSLALRGRSPLPGELFPRPPRLGDHPTIEKRLRRLRRELAAQEGHSAYVVFPNSALAQLCAERPRSLADLAQVPGFGAVRVRRYGNRILAALKA